MHSAHARRLRITTACLAGLAGVSLACGFSPADLGDDLVDLPERPRFGPPGGSIAETSRTPACRQELQRALEVFRVDEGMDFTAGPDEAETLMETGTIGLPYARDRETYTPTFGIDGATGCQLVLYALITQGGRSTTHLNDRVTLNAACQCAPPASAPDPS